MKRRDFLNMSFATVGGVLLGGEDVLSAQVMNEISAPFNRKNLTENYDLIIHGAGLAGYFAAMAATRKGWKVLVLDKHPFPGYDITAKRNLRISVDGINDFDPSFLDLFLPEGEKQEILNPGYFPHESRFGDDLLLFAGSIKKGILRNMLVNNIHVLLMTDVCGMITEKKSVSGVLVSCKHGMYTIRCKSFLDASDNNFFTRDLFNQPYKITEASYILEFAGAGNIPEGKTISISPSFQLTNNQLMFYPGKRLKDQAFMEFSFPVEKNDLSGIEQKARNISASLCQNLSDISPLLANARLHCQAYECRYVVDRPVETFSLNAYYHIPNPASLAYQNIKQLLADATSLVEEIKFSSPGYESGVIEYIGGTIPYQWKGEEITEEGLKLPLTPFILPSDMPVEKVKTSILVAGGGTAGAMTAMAAAGKKVKTLVVEFFHDLGGTKTTGGVSGEYFGYQDSSLYKRQKQEIKEFNNTYHMAGWTGRAFYHLKKIGQSGGQVMTGAIICGAITEKNHLKGIVVCENGRLKKVMADMTVDGTGDADIAYFAGEKCELGNSRTGKTQDYSHWDIPVKNMPTHNHRDFDMIDNTKISEFQRGLFFTHYESHFYDFYPHIGVRESRRPLGVYQLNVNDVLENRNFNDLLANARSDFDPHYTGSSEYSRCGFLLPHSNTTITEIPYRSIVPSGIEGLLFSARGISVTHNAMQYTRMSADVWVLGYLTGQIAAELVKRKKRARTFDISSLQKGWLKEGIIKHLPENKETTVDRVKRLAGGEPGSLFSCCRSPKEEILPVLRSTYRTNPSAQIARALAWFGDGSGNSLIEKELETVFLEELKQGYPNGYVEHYKEDGLYWRINRDIALLGMSGNKTGSTVIHHILSLVSSGGGLMLRENDYDNNRIDMRLIPFHNRILNLCFYIERLPDARYIPNLERLLSDKNIGGYITRKYENVRWRVYQADMELFIAAALARCGGKKGLEVLTGYLSDVHSDFRGFAHSELVATLGKDFNYSAGEWINYIETLTFPGIVTPLIKEIEL
ncbi:MAG: FAD-dependent oxidoreductase [Bacteroidales bacterium]|nr:FAD-dependent oxidoreductase [Bacteroidales bacterium]